MAYRLDYLVKTDNGDINTLRAYIIQNDRGTSLPSIPMLP